MPDHLIDPRTGRPADTDLDAVTVLAGHGWSAEVLATAALIAGSGDALDLVESAGAVAVTVDLDGGVGRSAGVTPFLATALPDRLSIEVSRERPALVVRRGSGGLVAWGLVTASVLWGLLLSSKALGRRVRAAWLLDLHRFLGGAALVFTALHVGALVLDSTVQFGLSELLVPLASAWRPVAVAWGVVGLYLVVAVELTSLLRRRLPRRWWRRTHMLSFPLWVLATVHGLTAGTDASNPVVLGVAVLGTLAVLTLTLVRLLQHRASPAGRTGPPRIHTAIPRPAPLPVSDRTPV